MPQTFINRLKAFNDTLEAAASQGNQPRINNEFIRLDYEADRGPEALRGVLSAATKTAAFATGVHFSRALLEAATALAAHS